ncbi:ABC transporter ATP-binding protein [Paenibacillus sp. FSL L8-0696]|uniref:ABC transporter ATP-binding protein n=1 Tax=Paenibacillus sp. FSL L8-0696 TaxID=2954524 RepID=UPI00311A3555
MDKGVKNREIYLRLFSYTRSFRLLFLFALLLVFVEVTYYITYSAIQEYFLNAINNGNGNQLNNLLMWYSAGALILILLFFILFFCNNYINELIQKEISIELFDKINKLPFSYLQSNHTGDLLSRLNSDVQKASQVISYISFNSLFWVVFFVSSFVYLSRISFKLTVMIVVFTPLLIFIGRKFSKKMVHVSLRVQESKAQVRIILQELIQGMQVIRSYNLQGVFLSKYLNAQLAENSNIKSQKITEYLMIQSIETLSKLISTLVFVILGFSIIDGNITVGAFAVFITLIRSLQQPVEEITKELGKAQEGIVAAKRVFSIIDLQSEYELMHSTSDICVSKQMSPTPAIEFVNVNFQYESGATLKNITLQINEGQKIAVVGASGAGKTTFIRLCLGLLKPTNGEIRIFGRNLFENLERSRSYISYIPQTPYLFSGTILENIAYGDSNKSADEIDASIKLANAHFIYDLQGGLNYNVGENGRRLSGGQRQRLAIARAFFKKSPIIVLDEATSALDHENEKLIYDSIDNLLENKTAIIIAHRLTTIQNADMIIVLEDGKIVESGSHEDLLKNGGRYTKLYSSQSNV